MPLMRKYFYFLVNNSAAIALHFPFKYCRKLTILNDNIHKSLSPLKLPSYELLDSGNFRRLEKFDDIIVSRSCPSANWNPVLPRHRWTESTHLSYEGSSGKFGEWKAGGLKTSLSKHVLECPADSNHSNSSWRFQFETWMTLQLFPSDMGQVGVFPEQAANWKWIRGILMKSIESNIVTPLTVLNGFAYTGGSTMAALSVPGVQVVHLDSSKASVQQARRNAEISGLSNRPVRWIVDDCLTFVDREIRRRQKDVDNNNGSGVVRKKGDDDDVGSRSPARGYDGLIFDPPAFGRGGVQGKMKTWQIEKDLPLLMQKIPQLLSSRPLFILITCHDERWSAERLYEELAKVLSPLRLGGKYERGVMELNPVRNPDEFLSSAVALSCEADDEDGSARRSSKGPSSRSGSGSVGKDMDSVAEGGRPLRLGSFVRWSRKPTIQINP